MGTKIMRVDEEFFDGIKEETKKTGKSGIKITKQLAKKLRKKKRIKEEGWGFRI